jgi:hypothetical protein
VEGGRRRGEEVEGGRRRRGGREVEGGPSWFGGWIQIPLRVARARACSQQHLQWPMASRLCVFPVFPSGCCCKAAQAAARDRPWY